MSIQQQKILIIDDDRESLLPLKLFLEEVSGFNVTLTAENNVVKLISSERFDLVCLDVMIPPSGIDEWGIEVSNIHFSDVPWYRTGIELLHRLRAGAFSFNTTGTPPDVPVILISSLAYYDTIANELKSETKLGNFKFIEKPFALEEFLDCLSSSLQ